MAEPLHSVLRGRNRPVLRADLVAGPTHYAPVRPAGWRPEPGPVEVRARAFARASGRPFGRVVEAIILGFVPGDKVIREVNGEPLAIWVVHLERADQTVDDFLDRLEADWPRLRSIAEFRWYARCLVVCGLVGHAVPDAWVEDYIALPDAHDHDSTVTELRAVYSGTERQVTALGRRVDLRRFGYLGVDRLAPVEGDPRELLRSALSAGVPDLVGTCLESTVGKLRASPSPLLTGRLLAMEGAARDVAIADTCDAMENASIVRDHALPLSHWRMAKVLAGVSRGDHRNVRRRIKAYLGGRILRSTAPQVRLDDVTAWMACERRMAQWASEPVGEALRAWLLDNKPEVPRDRGFYNMVSEADAKLRRSSTRRRKARSDLIAADYDGWLAEAEAKRASATLAKEEFAKAHELAGDDPDYRHSYEAPLLGDEWNDTGELMLVNVRSVRVSWLVGKLAELLRAEDIKEGERSFFSTHAPGGIRHDPEFWNSRVIIYEGVERMAGGPPPNDPEWARCFVSGVLLPPSDLTNELVERRRCYLADTGIATYDEIPAGLMRADDAGTRTLMKWTLAVMDKAVVTIDQYHRGISTGRVLYRVIAKRLVRVGAAMQIVDDKVRWTKIDTDFGKRPAFKAVPKLCHEQRLKPYDEKVVAYGIDFDTFGMIGELIRLIIKVDGGDPADPKKLRLVEPANNLPFDCALDRYLFQFAGQALDVSALAFCMGHLFGRRVLPHDIRHGGAGRSYEDGHPIEQVKNRMDHSREARTKEYIKRGDGRMIGQGLRTIRLRDEAQALGGPRRGRAAA